MEQESQEPLNTGFDAKNLAWASLACGVVSWFLAAFIPIGIELAGIILGVLAIRRARDDQRGPRRIAIWGVVISVVKLVAVIGFFAFAMTALAVNPMAH